MVLPLVGIAAGVAARAAAKKAAQTAVKKVAKKAATTAAAKANARGLKAAQGKSLASPVKKAVAKKNTKERVVTKNLAESAIKIRNKDPKSAYAGAAKAADDMKARDIKFSKKNPSNVYNKKTMKNVKKMEDVPKDVSDRFNSTLKRLAAEEAKKKKK